MMICSISTVTLVKLPYHDDDNESLVVMEGMTHVPFSIARIFVVTAPNGAKRGRHAHKECAQFLTFPTGGVEVLYDDDLNNARNKYMEKYKPSINWKLIKQEISLPWANYHHVLYSKLL